MTRSVTVFEHWRPDVAKVGTTWEKRIRAKGQFHRFSVDYEECGENAGNFAVAIVELPNGEVITPPANLIQFTDDSLHSQWGYYEQQSKLDSEGGTHS